MTATRLGRRTSWGFGGIVLLCSFILAAFIARDAVNTSSPPTESDSELASAEGTWLRPTDSLRPPARSAAARVTADPVAESQDGLIVRLAPESACRTAGATVWARRLGDAWERVGLSAAGEPFVWGAPFYPCELLVEAAGCVGTLAVRERPAPGGEGRRAEVVVALSSAGRIAGTLVGGSPGVSHEHGSVFYRRDARSPLPRSRSQLEALPTAIGGVLAVGPTGEFELAGLSPGADYRLWALSAAGVSQGLGESAVAGTTGLSLRLHELRGFQLAPDPTLPEAAAACLHRGRGGFSFSSVQGAWHVWWHHPPIRWTAWRDHLEAALNEHRTPYLVAVNDPLAPLDPVRVLGGPPGFASISITAPLARVAVGDELRQVPLSLERAPEGLGSVRVEFERADRILGLAPDAMLGMLMFVPLEPENRGARIQLAAEDYPQTTIPCVPAGAHRVIINAAYTGLSNDPDGQLPIVVVEDGETAVVRVRMRAWGSIAVDRVDGEGLPYTGRTQIFLEQPLESGELPEHAIAGGQRTRVTCSGVEQHADFVPPGYYEAWLVGTSESDRTYLGPLTVRDGETSVLAVP